jgi:hypothetical protein
MVLTPKIKFLDNPDYVRLHQELVVSDRFRAAVEASLVEQIMALPSTHDHNEAAAAYYRIMGARDFISHLLNIAETSKPIAKPLSANLDHSIR